MKKKWLSILALSMTACMGVSAFSGCDFLGGDSSGSSQRVGNLTEDEIYAEISEAMDASLAHQGGRTMHYTSIAEASGGRDDNEYTVSVDPATNRIYTYSKMDYAYEGYTDFEMTKKIFKQGNTYYLYDKTFTPSDNETDEEYKRITETDAIESIKHNEILEILQESDKYLGNIQSIETMNLAHAEVVADTKALAAALPPEQSVDIDGEATFSCQYQSSGTYTFLRTCTIELATGTQMYRQVKEFQVTAKDGWITGVCVTQEDRQTTYTTEDRTTVAESSYATQKRDVTFTYHFDETEYNKIQVQIPSDVQQGYLMKYAHQYEKALVINGEVYSTNYTFNGYGFEETLQNIISGAGFSPVDVVWYTDEACTKPLTADITEAEFSAIPTLYGKATVSEYAEAAVLVIEESVFGDDVNDYYKLVFDSVEKTTGSVYSASGNVYTIYNYDDATVYVNGEELVFADGETTKTITVADGEICVIKKVIKHEKENLTMLSKGFGF